MTIPLFEDADSPTGTFTNYDTYDAAQLAQLPLQRHADIRSFVQNDITEAAPMFLLDNEDMGELDVEEMGGLVIAVRRGENWMLNSTAMGALDTETMSTLDGETMLTLDGTTATVGPQSDRQYFNGISMTTAAQGIAFSVMDPVTLAAFAPTDVVSMALPAFPLSNVTTSACFLDLTSAPAGDFAIGPTASAAFSASATTLANGDCEASWPLSTFAAVNLTSITGVRIRITATSSATFRCLAIRCITPTWELAPTDQNTLYDAISRPVPRSGTATSTFTFPVAAPPVSPSHWPVLLWAEDQAGNPAIRNTQIGFLLDSGAMVNANSIILYSRELAATLNTITDLDGIAVGDLDGEALDIASSGTVDDFANTLSETVTIQWGSTNAVSFGNQGGARYTLTDLALTPATTYYCLVTFSETSARIQVYNVAGFGGSVVDYSSAIYDTGAISDPTLYSIRLGRFGWFAHLGDGNASIRKLRPIRTVYGTYESLPLLSDTPVTGARLYVECSPDNELYTSATGFNATLSPDFVKSSSGKSIKVSCSGVLPNEGLLTNAIRFENLADTVIEFDILASATDEFIGVITGSAGQYTLFPVGPFPINHWTHKRISLQSFASTLMPGEYQLLIAQARTSENFWFIDNLSVHTKSVAWSGTSQATDPWRIHKAKFYPFGDTVNDPYGGLVMGPGNALQIRGEYVAQNGAISGLQVLPQYATLGNFLWANGTDTINTPILPPTTVTTSFIWTPAGSTTVSGVTVPTAAHATSLTFTATATINNQGDDPEGPLSIVSYFWEFGDGFTSTSMSPTHTYKVANPYVFCTLTVTDSLGRAWGVRQPMRLS